MAITTEGVLTVKRWLLSEDADALEPQGWERRLLLALARPNSPYTFFLTEVQPDEQHPRTRYFASWATSSVIVNYAAPRFGKTFDEAPEPARTLQQAKSDLRRMFRELTGASDHEFDAAWALAAKIARYLRAQEQL